jgi:DNA-binding MarR family transcriptional regulator
MAASTSSAPSAEAGEKSSAASLEDTETPGLAAEKCSYVLGDDGLATWSDMHAEAWIGLLETHKRLVRALDAELEAEHGLTLSALEVLARLARAPGRNLRLSALAEACGLSLSRISRIIDALQERGLVERRGVQSDARAVHAHLSGSGLELVKRAQCSHFAAVQRRFFEHLSAGEVATLARIFGRFAPRTAEACGASAATPEASDASAAPKTGSS